MPGAGGTPRLTLPRVRTQGGSAEGARRSPTCTPKVSKPWASWRTFVTHRLAGDCLPGTTALNPLGGPWTTASGTGSTHLGHTLGFQPCPSLHSAVAGLLSHTGTKPSYTRLTAIDDPKAPCATGTPCRATAASNASRPVAPTVGRLASCRAARLPSTRKMGVLSLSKACRYRHTKSGCSGSLLVCPLS